jgi:hypothetical protein
MTPHQSINDLGVLIVAATAGKISVMLSETANAPDWINRITGPFGALVVMAIGLWYFSVRDAKQDKKMDERQAAKDKEDADHKTAQIETAKQLAETNTRLQIAIDQNTRVIETNSRALDKHPCTK